MKKLFVLCVTMLMAFSLGCVSCGPGYGRLCAPGPVNYVDGNGGQLNHCGPGVNPCTSSCATSCGNSYGSSYGSPHCLPAARECAARICYGMRILGEGALNVVAVPFIIVGDVLTGCGSCAPGYAPYNSGDCCSSEVYYGDNCYQAHDFNDPCGCNGMSPMSGCSRCSDTTTDGMQFEPPQQVRSSIGIPTSSIPQSGSRGIQPVSFVSPSRPVTGQVR